MKHTLMVSNADVWAAFMPKGHAAIAELLKQPMKPRAARAAQTLAREAAAAFADIDKARQSLCRKHAEVESVNDALVPKVVNGEYVFVDRAAFDADMQDLLSEHIELNARAISDSELDESARLTPADMERLGPFLTAVK